MRGDRCVCESECTLFSSADGMFACLRQNTLLSRKNIPKNMYIAKTSGTILTRQVLNCHSVLFIITSAVHVTLTSNSQLPYRVWSSQQNDCMRTCLWRKRQTCRERLKFTALHTENLQEEWVNGHVNGLHK